MDDDPVQRDAHISLMSWPPRSGSAQTEWWLFSPDHHGVTDIYVSKAGSIIDITFFYIFHQRFDTGENKR